MLNIGNKNYMNLQEAVAWLLENNALPFQSTANYAGNTEIAMSTLINPSPAKVRVGSIIFFADSKVSTVIGVTSNSFICSDQYNDLVDDVVYVSNVAQNASGHLIVTLSNGDTIDAGLIKQVSSFSINASQHLVVSYNDGTSTDLGAIFNGNINISGNLTVSGGISGGAITGDSIIENMSGYSFIAPTASTNVTQEIIYASAVKNGNKLTVVIFEKVVCTDTPLSNYLTLGAFSLPASVLAKLYPTTIDGANFLDNRTVSFFKSLSTAVDLKAYCQKGGSGITLMVYGVQNLTHNTDYFARYELTFLLSDNMAS